MPHPIPKSLTLIAGQGLYPLLAVEGARRAGVARIEAIGFRGQTARSLARAVDAMTWLRVGQLGLLLDKVRDIGNRDILLAGQITPSCLFSARFDKMARAELRGLSVKSAHAIFGRLSELLVERGTTVLPASLFMNDHIPSVGVLTRLAPDEREQSDIDHGMRVALALGELDVGQTVVVRSGMVTAVEAFEGTNRAILRGARLGGTGCVVVKAARAGHDMRFDIPVLGARTLRIMRRARIRTLAVQAGRAVLLDRANLIRAADRLGFVITAEPCPLPPAPVASP